MTNLNMLLFVGMFRQQLCTSQILVEYKFKNK